MNNVIGIILLYHIFLCNHHHFLNLQRLKLFHQKLLSLKAKVFKKQNVTF
jgi:hypothetical protein